MSAIISTCGKHRYRLERDVCDPFEGSKVFAFFGINPSTADAAIDDATVRKWRGFTTRNNGHRFIVGNVFSYRATDVNELSKTHEYRGPDYFKHINNIIENADVLIPCWGSRAKLPRTLYCFIEETLGVILNSGKPVLHFGLTISGDPKHPLMLGYSTPLIPLPSVIND